MCNTQTQQFIDQVVSDKVNSDVMFTLFDVTLEVQSLEKAAGLPVSRHRHIHDDVAATANAEALSQGWSRQLQSMGGNLSAFVYFNPAVHDVSTYQPLNRNANDGAKTTVPGVNPAALAFASQATQPIQPVQPNQPVTPPNFASPTDSTSPILGAPSNQGCKNVDRWNRLRLTCDVMRQAGFNPGDMVYASAEHGKLVLSRTAGTYTIAKYIVDCYCNLRITSKTLKAANLAATAYKMTATPDTVTIEP